MNLNLRKRTSWFLKVEAILFDRIRYLRTFLIVSFALGIGDSILTRIVLGFGLEEGSPLHRWIGPDTIVSDIVGTFGIPLLMVFMSFMRRGKLLPHILVLVQLVNVVASLVIVLLLVKGRLVI